MNLCTHCYTKGEEIEATVPKTAPRLCRKCKDADLKANRDKREGVQRDIKERRDILREIFLTLSKSKQGAFRAKYVSVELVFSRHLNEAINWCFT